MNGDGHSRSSTPAQGIFAWQMGKNRRALIHALKPLIRMKFISTFAIGHICQTSTCTCHPPHTKQTGNHDSGTLLARQRLLCKRMLTDGCTVCLLTNYRVALNLSKIELMMLGL